MASIDYLERIPNNVNLAGNRRLIDGEGVIVDDTMREDEARLYEAGRTVIFVAIDRRIAGVIGIADEVKATAARAVDALHNLGLRVIMITGDHERAAASVAAATGIREYHAGATPVSYSRYAASSRTYVPLDSQARMTP